MYPIHTVCSTKKEAQFPPRSEERGLHCEDLMKKLYSILLVVGSVVLIGFFMITLLVDYAVFSMVGFIGIAIMMLALHFSDKQ